MSSSLVTGRPGPIRDRLDAEFGVAFNAVLANRYRDGMGWHADDEAELDPAAAIARGKPTCQPLARR